MSWIIDAHAHLDDEKFNEDLDELIARLPGEGVLAVVNPGCDLESSTRAIEIADRYDQVFACVGTHPHEARFYDKELEAQYLEWTKKDKVIAIGEIGLDYHYDFSPRDIQRQVFESQLQLAFDCGLPLVIHSREAVEDTYDILKKFRGPSKILMHSFGENMDWTEKFLDLGCYVSLGGMVTFKNAVNPPEIAHSIPQDRLLLETDAPYLAPVPKRGRRNEPGYARYSLEKIAELRGVPICLLADQILKNTVDFYGFGKEMEELKRKLDVS